MAEQNNDVIWLVEKNAELQDKLVKLAKKLSKSEDRATRLNALLDEMYSYLVRIGKNKEFSVEHDLRERKRIREAEKNG